MFQSFHSWDSAQKACKSSPYRSLAKMFSQSKNVLTLYPLALCLAPSPHQKIYIMPHTVHHVLLDVYHLARIKANHQLFKWTCSLVYHLAIAPISIKNFSHPLFPLQCISPSISGKGARRWTSFAVLALYFFLFFLCCRGARRWTSFAVLSLYFFLFFLCCENIANQKLTQVLNYLLRLTVTCVVSRAFLCLLCLSSWQTIISFLFATVAIR